MRFFIFMAIAAFMVAGPVVEQVFGTRTVFWRSWTMFSGIGLGMIDASFATRKPDGTAAPLDRFELLKARRDGQLKRIENADELTAIIQQLCTALGPGADLRVTARQATRDGWRIIRTESENACTG